VATTGQGDGDDAGTETADVGLLNPGASAADGSGGGNSDIDASASGAGSDGFAAAGGARACLDHPLELQDCGCGADWFAAIDDGQEDRVISVETDQDGNVIAGGRARTNWTYSAWVRKYDPYGEELWASVEPGILQDVAVDPSGSIVVAGYTEDAEGWIRKYDPDGAEVWTIENDRLPSSVAMDPNGNVFVVAPGVGATKYDREGEQLWDRSEGVGQGFAIAVDRDGNAVVAGNLVREEGAVNGFNPHLDVVVLKLAPDGAELWVHTYDGGRDDLAQAVAVDANGNVFVAGMSRLEIASGGLADQGFLRKLSPLGDVLWTRTEHVSSAQYADLAIDLNGGVIVAWRPLYAYDEHGASMSAPACVAERVNFDPSGRAVLAGSVDLPGDGTFTTFADAWLGAYAF
jgi:hypothetical protein